MKNKKPLVVITGASAGIGKALAIRFTEESYPCLLISRHIEPLAELKGRSVMYAALDITDYERFEIAVRDAEKNMAKPNV